jgi:hypothetical protein
MTSKAQFTQVYGYGNVTNDAASLDIVAAPGNGLHIYIEKLYLNVYEPAIGSGGICKLIDTNGVEYFPVNVDGVKEISFDFGNYGWRIPTANVGLQLVVSDANTKQASVSVILKGHLHKEA